MYYIWNLTQYLQTWVKIGEKIRWRYERFSSIFHRHHNELLYIATLNSRSGFFKKYSGPQIYERNVLESWGLGGWTRWVVFSLPSEAFCGSNGYSVYENRIKLDGFPYLFQETICKLSLSKSPLHFNREIISEIKVSLTSYRVWLGLHYSKVAFFSTKTDQLYCQYHL